MSAPIDILKEFGRAQDEAHDAESAASDACYHLGKIAEELESIVTERDALRHFLREIVHGEDSREQIIERAEKLLESK